MVCYFKKIEYILPNDIIIYIYSLILYKNKKEILDDIKNYYYIINQIIVLENINAIYTFLNYKNEKKKIINKQENKKTFINKYILKLEIIDRYKTLKELTVVL